MVQLARKEQGPPKFAEHGLSSSEAAQRLAQFGPNEIRRERATPSIVILARQFASPVIWLLLAAMGVSLAVGLVPLSVIEVVKLLKGSAHHGNT